MRKRPLFTAALLAVLLTALWLEIGGVGRAGPGQVGPGELEASSGLLVTGQVYQKDETSIYLKSVSLMQSSDAHGQWSQESGSKIPCQDNFICETQQGMEIPLGSTVTLKGVYAPFPVPPIRESLIPQDTMKRWESAAGSERRRLWRWKKGIGPCWRGCFGLNAFCGIGCTAFCPKRTRRS